MSVGKKKDVAQKQFTGTVVLKPVAVGSKSEHEALCLRTAGTDYLLRRVGGNAFHDPVLHDLKGKQITVSGIVHNYTLLVREILNKEA